MTTISNDIKFQRINCINAKELREGKQNADVNDYETWTMTFMFSPSDISKPHLVDYDA